MIRNTITTAAFEVEYMREGKSSGTLRRQQGAGPLRI